MSKMVLPFITASVAELSVRALVDSGCEQSVLSDELVKRLHVTPQGPNQLVTMLNGCTTNCRGVVGVDVKIGSLKLSSLVCLVAPKLVLDCDLILGIDAITKLGGVSISSDGKVVFSGQHKKNSAICAGVVDDAHCCSSRDTDVCSVEVHDGDFDAFFDGDKWTVKWKWLDKEPTLKNTCSEYTVHLEQKELYDCEIGKWIDNGWLQPYSKAIHGNVEGIIPLMAVSQPNKLKKVRPVMDYSKELNFYVKSNPGLDSAICQDKLRKWRLLGNKVSILDLKSAYLQLHVHSDLQRFQAVRYNNKLYVMTRMGFGLNVAPKIMTKIVAKVLSLDETVNKGTDHYIDDIVVNESIVTAETVRKHLFQFGLVSKEPVPVEDARVLGLRVSRNRDAQLSWSRDTEIPKVESHLTKREVFSLCGKLTGHYPIANWLRVACSYVKRIANNVEWNELVPHNAMTMVYDLVDRVKENDPVHGKWVVDNINCGTIWCDASSIAMGVCLEVGNNVVEDATWLRSVGDCDHINTAELEAVVKGLNLTTKWNLKKVIVVTDSATVYRWVSSVVENSHRPKVSGLSEMIIRRRLSIIAQLIVDYQLTVHVKLVKSNMNKADALTRVSKKWLTLTDSTTHIGAIVRSSKDLLANVRRSHDSHHLGLDRTFYIARSVLGDEVTYEMAQTVVRECHVCRRIDPAPVRWDRGQLCTNIIWQRLAADITHYQNVPYLTVVDCGPSRFVLWRQLKNETGAVVKAELERIFYERGPCKELLTDNGPCFRDSSVNRMLNKWGIEHLFSCAYRASGNGIVERNHRTIKRIAARCGGGIYDATYWYNNTPDAEGNIPAQSLYNYKSKLPNFASHEYGVKSAPVANPFAVRDYVYVKPANAKCTTVWPVGQVTKLISNTTVEVNGVNRHVSDLRPAWHHGESTQKTVTVDILDGNDEERDDDDDGGNSQDVRQEQSGVENVEVESRRSVRDRRPPQWLADFYVE